MLDKTQVTKIAVAGFGAAMASVYAIPEAHATILPISFNPSKASFTPYSVRTQWVSSGNGQFKTSTVVRHTVLVNAGSVGAFNVYNDTYGKTIFFSGGRLRRVSGGQVLSPGSFGNGNFVLANTGAAGSDYVGFKTSNGNTGWFEVNWGGSGGAIQFLKGGYGNAGESIIVGSMDPVPSGGSSGSGGDVPEPSELGLFTLGLLALGAAGVRMRRDARKAAEFN